MKVILIVKGRKEEYIGSRSIRLEKPKTLTFNLKREDKNMSMMLHKGIFLTDIRYNRLRYLYVDTVDKEK